MQHAPPRPRPRGLRRGLQRAAAIAAFSFAASNVPTVAADDLVKVMSFNVRTSYAAVDRGGACSNWGGVRKNNVAAQITTVGPDFVGTQETSGEQKGFLDGALSGTYTSIGKSTGSLNGAADEYTAIWYNHQKWKLLTQGTFWLGPNPDAPSAAWGMKYYRTAQYGRFQSTSSGKTVCVFNTHYEEPGNDEAQKHGSQIIMDRVKAVCTADDKFTVITGDFNAQMNYPAIQMYFTNGWKEESSSPTFCGDMLGAGCGTKFDFTLHKLADGVCLAKDEVIRQNFAGCYPSDHAVLMATFCIEGSCCSGQSSTSPSPTQGNNDTTTTLTPEPFIAMTGSGSQASNSTLVGAGEQGTVKPAPSDNTGAPAGSSGPTEVNMKSASTSGGAGTFMAVFGVVGVVAATLGVVIKKKRGLEAMLGMNKNDDSGGSPNPWFFRASDASALSPKRKPEERNTGSSNDSSVPRMSAPSEDGDQSNMSPISEGRSSRGFSSPVPTLGHHFDDERGRSISDSSSIACLEPSIRGTNDRESSDRFTSDCYSSARLSSPILLDDQLKSNKTFRGSSRIYFGDLSVI